MKTFVKYTAFIAIFTLTAISCGESTDVVDSGTYTGKITEVNAEETEIYVNLENGQTIELYFTDTTTLTENGEEVPFSTIEVDDRVEVTVEKVGQRLDPVSVVLLDN